MEKQSGLTQISVERGEQLFKHGKTVEYDVLNNQHHELVRAALIILLEGNVQDWESLGSHWPEGMYYKIIYDKTQTERWAIAGALLAAAIDREQMISGTIEFTSPGSSEIVGISEAKPNKMPNI